MARTRARRRRHVGPASRCPAVPRGQTGTQTDSRMSSWGEREVYVVRLGTRSLIRRRHTATRYGTGTATPTTRESCAGASRRAERSRPTTWVCSLLWLMMPATPSGGLCMVVGGGQVQGKGKGCEERANMVECECGEGHDVIERQKTKNRGCSTRKHISDDVALWSKQNLGSAGGK